MKLEPFELERTQSLWENTVAYNLTETGVHPLSLDELLDREEIEELCKVRLGYGQTNGSIPLREAISQQYPGTDRDHVLVTTGSVEANFVAMWNLLEPGDELVLMLPNYMQIWGIARSFGATVKPFYLQEDNQWQPDLKALHQAVTPQTKIIAVCNPNNPTGSVLREEAMGEIVRLAEAVGAWVYADEVYRGAELNGTETPTFHGRTEKVIVAGGLSKAYALPGLRVGWLVGPHETMADCWARRDYTSISTTMLSNRIAARVLQPDLRDRILKRNRTLLRQNLGTLTQWIREHDGLFTFQPPQAGGMSFLRYYIDLNSTTLVDRLREAKSTFVVAGDCFGMDHHLRVGIGAEPDYLREGLSRFGDWLVHR